MLPKDPSDTNINANQTAVLDVAEHFFKQKIINEQLDKDIEGRKKQKKKMDK